MGKKTPLDKWIYTVFSSTQTRLQVSMKKTSSVDSGPLECWNRDNIHDPALGSALHGPLPRSPRRACDLHVDKVEWCFKNLCLRRNQKMAMVEWEKLEELWCKVNLGMDMSWRCYVGILIARAHILETASLSENRSQVVSGKSGITAWASTDVILFSYTLTFSPRYCTNSGVRSLTSCTVTSLTLSITTLSCDLGPSHVFSFHCPYSCLKLKTFVFSLPRMHWLNFSHI